MSSIETNFVVFAHGRSGSSSLLKALQLHPALRVAEEPFHQKYQQWYPGEPCYIDLIHDIPSLERQLTDIFSKYDGMKILDYQLSQDLYAHMLLKPDIKIVSLKRRNILQSIISGFIAEQTGVWKKWELTEDISQKYENLVPVPLDEIENRLSYAVELRSYYLRVLAQKSAGMHLSLIYEDMYSTSIELNHRTLQKVYEFLGVGIEGVNAEKLDYFLNPQTSKINNNSTYGYLPNAQEINEKFGNDETGWLFLDSIEQDSQVC